MDDAPRRIGPGETIHACTVCGEWFVVHDVQVSCTVAHALGSCCHYGQEPINGPIELTPRSWT